MKPISKLAVAGRVKARLQDHADWWRENRKGAEWTVKKAATRAYAEIRSNPEVGTPYEAEGFVGVRCMKTATEHALYYVVVDSHKPYVVVIGVKGPWEDKPYFVAADI